MIRVFQAFSKSLFYKTTAIELFHKEMSSFRVFSLACSSCRSKHSCTLLRSYKRYLVVIENGSPKTYTLDITRVKCNCCGSSHAILPDCIVPGSSYALSFILYVLLYYYQKTYTVEQLCDLYQISASTLYAWKKLFLKNKRLFLGILEDAACKPETFLNSLLQPGFYIQDFFHTFQQSFMQFAFTTHYNSS